jgi:two-component sensor histidine kinase
MVRGAMLRNVGSFLLSIQAGSLRAYLVATVIIGIAALVGWGLGFVVHDPVPFITFYPAVVFVTFVGGAAVGVFSVISGAVLAWWLFMPRHGTLLPSDISSQATLATYLVAALGMAWCSDYARRLAKRIRDEERLRALAVQELGHRLKNKILTIQAVVGMRLQAYPEIRKEIQGALTALATADDLLMASQASGADLRAILVAEVKPYGAGRGTLAGPEVLLPSQLALVMALLVHELATNAAKYGAFSVPGGRVCVKWSLNGGRLELEWRESDGPEVIAPARQGFGTRLFSRAIEPLGGTAHVEFARDGLICRLAVPLYPEK